MQLLLKRVFAILMSLLMVITAFPQLPFSGGGQAYAAPSNQLSSLLTSIPEIVFDPATETYSATVTDSTISVRAQTVDPFATMKLVEWNMDLPQNITKVLALEKGQNTISIRVTAVDSSQRTYVLNVTRAVPSSDSTLSGLYISKGTLSPGFDPSVTSYTASVPFNVSGITIEPTANHPGAVPYVYESALTGGASGLYVNLSVGSNTIPLKVIAEDGSETMYTLVVTRAAAPLPDNADLLGIGLSVGALDPVFSSTITEYTVPVANGVGEITITPTLSNSSATLKVNGSSHVNGMGYKATLNLGDNLIEFKVTAQDGVNTKMYTVNVKREIMDNNTLTDLELESGTLAPVFSKNHLRYTVNVGPGVSTFKFKPVTYQSSAKLAVNGNSLTNGDWYTTPTLSAGDNIFNIKVTPSGVVGSQYPMTYTVNVIRATPSADNNLTSLALSSGTLSPGFSPSITTYTVNVGYEVASIQLTPTLSDSTAKITVLGQTVDNNTAYTVNLTPGMTSYVPFNVTAQNGTVKQYYIEIFRSGPSTDNFLSNLTLSNGVLAPSFISLTPYYSTTLGSEVNSITVTPTASHSTATIEVNGEFVTSGAASQPISLQTGANPISIEVTAQSGSKRTYTVTVIRTPSNENTLSALGISQGTLSPDFAPSDKNYTASVPYSVSDLTVTPTVKHAGATVKVAGTTVTSGQGHLVNLYVGPNLIPVEVTAEDGSKTTYTITITRGAASTNADLSGLSLSSGTLSPAFSSGETSYTASVANGVSSIKVTPTALESHATVTVNGTTSGTIALNVGSNTVTVLVTAQDGTTTKTYTINVTRAVAPTTPTNPYVSVTGVSLDQTELTLQAGAEAITLLATVLPTNATNKGLNWTSSNPKVAIVDKDGAVTPLAPGKATITVATRDGNKTASVEVSVVEEAAAYLEATPSAFQLEPKKSARFKVYLVEGDKRTEITRDDETSYSINNKLISVKDGRITAGSKEGKSVITVNYQGKELEIQVAVDEDHDQDTISLEASEYAYWVKPKGSSSFKVYAVNGSKRTDITNDKNISYNIDDDLVSVKKGRIIAGNKEGESVITVRYQGEELEIPVFITSISVRSLKLSAAQTVLQVDEEKELTLTATLSNKKEKDVTDMAYWTSNNPEVVEVTEDGILIAVKPGTATITAKYGGKQVVNRLLVVKEKEPKALRVNRTSVQLKADQEVKIELTAFYDKGFKEAVSSTEVEWISEDPAIANVEDGIITAVAAGRTTITVSFGGKEVTIKVTVRK